VTASSERRATRAKGKRFEIILDALGAQLEHRPLAQLTVDELAEASGITRQRFYHYFPTKYDALAALVDRISDELTEAYLGPRSWFVRPPHLTPRETLIPTLEASVEIWERRGHILREASDLWNLPESVRTHWHRFMSRMVDFTAIQIKRERDAGIAPPGPDPRTMASQLMWMGERMAFLSCIGSPDAVGFERREIEAAATVFLRTIYLSDDPQLPAVE
jgi:AcrR family transcriptional regulator